MSKRITPKRKDVPLPPVSTLVCVKVDWKCKCGVFQTTEGPSIGASGGGCSGHSDGEYCYCPYPEAYIRLECYSCKVTEEFSF